MPRKFRKRSESRGMYLQRIIKLREAPSRSGGIVGELHFATIEAEL